MFRRFSVVHSKCYQRCIFRFEYTILSRCFYVFRYKLATMLSWSFMIVILITVILFTDLFFQYFVPQLSQPMLNRPLQFSVILIASLFMVRLCLLYRLSEPKLMWRTRQFPSLWTSVCRAFNSNCNTVNGGKLRVDIAKPFFIELKPFFSWRHLPSREGSFKG